MNRFFYFFLILFFVCVSGRNKAVSSPVIIVNDTVTHQSIGNRICYLEDKNGEFTIADISSRAFENKFIPHKASTPNFGVSKSGYWIRMDVLNAGSNPRNFILEIDFYTFYAIDFYKPLPDGQFKKISAGMDAGLKNKEIPHRNYLFSLQLKPGERKTYYMYTNNRGISNIQPMSVWDARRFIDKEGKENFLFGMYYGLIVLSIVINIFLFLALKDKLYLIYTLYVFFIGGLQFCLNGFFFQYFSEDNYWWSFHAPIFSSSFSVIFGIYFTQLFLNTERIVPIIHRILNYLLIAVILSFVLSLPTNKDTFSVAVVFQNIVVIIVTPMLIISGLMTYRKGFLAARFYLLAFSLLLAGACFYTLRAIGVLPSLFITDYGMQIGSALEVTILTFALAHRFKILRSEKSKAQAEALKQLEEMNKMKDEINIHLETQVKERTQELTVNSQKLLTAYKDIRDSINYAKRIQGAILPTENFLDKAFKDHFVIFRPKDIVSGDFYWAEELNGETLIAVADCTGHGVPGAFVSLLGYNGLNQAVNEKKVTKASDVLDELHKYMHQALHNRQTVEERQFDGISSNDSIRDGMDIALCCIDRKNLVLNFAGAVNPVYIIRNDEFIKIDGDKFSIGSVYTNDSFTNHMVQLQKGDAIYIFSDGYSDQFGGPAGKKFMKKQFKSLLLEIYHKTMAEQRQILEESFNSWRDDLDQVDDICVVGIRI